MRIVLTNRRLWARCLTQELAREAAVLRRALDAAQTELLALRSDSPRSLKKKKARQRNKKGKKKGKRRGWFSRNSATSMGSAAAGASSHSISGGSSHLRGTTPSGFGGLVEDGTGGASISDLRPDGDLVVNPNARRYTRKQHKQLLAALAAPTARSCRCPIDHAPLLARVLTFLPLREVRARLCAFELATLTPTHRCPVQIFRASGVARGWRLMLERPDMLLWRHLTRQCLIPDEFRGWFWQFATQSPSLPPSLPPLVVTSASGQGRFGRRLGVPPMCSSSTQAATHDAGSYVSGQHKPSSVKTVCV